MRGLAGVVVVMVGGAFAGAALAQSATVRIEGPTAYTPGEMITIRVYLDYEGLPPDALGLAGWNITIDIENCQPTYAGYMSDLSPLSDQNNPFGGDPAPQISGRSVHLTEGLNALQPASSFHTGGILAEIRLDTTGATDSPRARSRLGDSPLGAFTYALPAPEPFSFVGYDFEDAAYGQWEFLLPTPGTVGVLAIGGVAGVRRRR